KALPSPHQSPCCRGRCQKRRLGAATRPRESPSDSQFHRCSAQCAPRVDRAPDRAPNRDREDSRGTAPAARLFPRPLYPRDENRRPPAHPAAPRSPRLPPFATLPPTCAREMALPLLGDTTSVHGSRRDRVSRDACALSSPPPPHTVRPEENSAAPDPQRGPIPRSSFPRLHVEPGQGTDTPREREVCGAGALARFPTAAPAPH